MATGNLLVTKRVLLTLAVSLVLAAGIAIADVQGEFKFWLAVEKVEAVGATTYMLNGTVAGLPVRVQLDANTTAHDSYGQIQEIGSIKPGEILLVKAEWKTEYFTAREVGISGSGEVLLTGILESVSNSRIRVASADLKLDRATLMSAIHPGQLVAVRGRLDQDGGITAVSVEPQSGLRLFGVITDVGSSGDHEVTLQVASRTVKVTDRDTAIVAENGALTSGDLRQGQLVDIAGEFSGDAVLAKKIQVANPRDVTIRGTVSTFDSRTLSIDIAQTTLGVKTGRQTEIAGALAQGASVGVQATLLRDGSLLATRITVAEAGKTKTRPIVVRGIVESITGSSFKIRGVANVVTNTATVVVSKGSTLSVTAIKVGDQVSVGGTQQADGSILASKIEVIPAVPVMITVRGTVTSKVGNIFAVGTVQVTVDAQTVLVSKGIIFNYANLKAGDQVTVMGIKQTETSVVATKVEVVPATPVVTTVKGVVTSKGSTSFLVGTVTVLVDAQTAFVSKGATASYNDLKAGDQVAAMGTRKADGPLQATKVEITPATPPIVYVRGAISEKGGDYVKVGGDKVFVTRQTVIVAKDRTLTLSDLKVGYLITAAGIKQADGVLAAKIEVTGGM